MSSLATRTTHCFRCQRTPSSDGPPLQRCGGCRARHYCSKACQKNDWSYHKKECRALAANEPVPQRTRATYRINAAGLDAIRNGANSDSASGGSSDNNNSTTIYHLKTTLAHIKDISLSGPYASPAALAQQIKFRLAQAKATEGQAAFADMERAVGGMAHFNAPLPDGNVMRFEILKEENEAVKRAMPGETYVVVSMKPVMSMAALGVIERGEGHPQVEETEWHGTFVDKEKAKRKARAVLEEYKEDVEGGVVRMLNLGDGSGFVSGRSVGDVRRLVQVTLDDGSINDVDV